MIIGIDPGITGAMCALSRARDVLTLEVIPTHRVLVNRTPRRRVDAMAIQSCIADWTAQYKEVVDMVAVEDVHSMPKDGGVQAFAFGRTLGRIEGAIQCYGLPIIYISPMKWKRGFGLLKCPKGDSVEVANKLFPELKLKKTEHGKADAILIACSLWDIQSTHEGLQRIDSTDSSVTPRTGDQEG